MSRRAAMALMVLVPLLAGCIVNAPNHNITQTAIASSVVAAQPTTLTTTQPVPAPAGQPPTAQPAGPWRRVALSGVPQRIGLSYDVNPDCTSGGVPTVHLLAAPAHGTVTFQAVEDFPSFPPQNQRYDCNKKKLPMVAYSYKSVDAFKGRDELSVQVLTPRGEVLEHRYVVDVQ